ncbi:MAG: 5-formyltetrahydrofolate cyclo-ligase [Desulfobacterales bacterium]|nr:MAG: 5-formyltetrahydrofolate cyclo-ligase [Desulfobacterales bacterium]
MTTSDYRTLVLIRRKRQTKAAIRRKSSIIQQKLLAMEQIKTARHIFTYSNFRSEVETGQLISALLAENKIVSVPLCNIEKRLMEAVSIEKKEQLAPGAWGIPEPLPAVTRTGRANPLSIDVIIMPGAVFDFRGGRFGYGGGFYDRFVAGIPRAWRIAAAFELQLTSRLPLKDHDQLVDYIVTERRIIPTGRGELVKRPSAR